MQRAGRRPRRSATKAIIRSSVALPRSGLVVHWDPLASGPEDASARLAVIGNEHAMSDGLPGARNAEVYRAVRQPLVSERQRLTGVHRADELGGTDAPAQG